MGSVFVTQEDRTIKGFGGKKYKVPFYLQFVPGAVVEVITSSDSYSFKGDHTLNTIIATAHISDKLYKKRALSVGSEENRYYPLLRGMTDVPSKGDPVLLCTIGKINYYLGPLNTTTNSPTWNDDPSYKTEISPIPVAAGSDPGARRGESLNFNKSIKFSRLAKIRNENLDYGSVINEATGDMILEGRHGNSIRVGSRDIYPYLFISNHRAPRNALESLCDGSIISITSNGTLAQHFGGYVKSGTEASLSSLDAGADTSSEEIISGFKLASDTLEKPNIYMGQIISNVNNNADTQELIYDYNGDQILFHSDRITLNSKEDDIYLSSIKDIHIGTGRHLTISANEDLIIKSKRIFLGSNLSDKKEDQSEPMIMGQTLLELLKETLAIIKGSQGICQGAPIPLADDTGAPGGVMTKITSIEQKIETILSTKYYIEKN